MQNLTHAHTRVPLFTSQSASSLFSRAADTICVSLLPLRRKFGIYDVSHSEMHISMTRSSLL